MKATGRNDPCPCNSGKKFKSCCLFQSKTKQKKTTHEQHPMLEDPDWLRIREAEGTIELTLKKIAEEEFINSPIDAWKEFISVSEAEVDIEVYEPYFKTWFYYSWQMHDKEEDVESSLAEIALRKYPERFTELESKVLQAIVESPFSFFLVLDVVKGKSLKVKDLFQDKEHHVKEVIATKNLAKGTILFSRPITVDNQTIFVGVANYTIPPQYLNMVTDLRDKLLESVTQDGFTADVLLEFEMILRKAYFFIIEWAFQLKKTKNVDAEALFKSETLSKNKETLDEIIIKHYKKWMDTELLELDGLSPKDAAKTVKGRMQLEAMFKEYEKTNIELRAQGQDYRQVDINYLKKELNF